jgi:hypothetical protein
VGETNSTEEERWRPVAGYEGFYEVSDQGAVKSVTRIIPRSGTVRTPHPMVLNGRIRKPSANTSGHMVVSLSKIGKTHGKLVHRLVLEAFIGPCPDGMEGCHNNGDPSDNRLANLRWDTRSNNALDAVAHGTHTQRRKTHCPQGHAYTAENIAPSSWPGGRVCKACHGSNNRHNRDKTHCKRGHEFTAENTRITSDGRSCRQCMAIHRANRRARLALAANGNGITE